MNHSRKATTSQDVDRPMTAFAVGWTPVGRGALIGHADVRYESLLLRACPVLRSSGRTWVGLPAKPMIDKNDRVIRGADGKARFQTILEWPNRDIADRFSQAVLGSLIRQHGPDAFEGDGS